MLQMWTPGKMSSESGAVVSAMEVRGWEVR
jgi:hypothetical protein